MARMSQASPSIPPQVAPLLTLLVAQTRAHAIVLMDPQGTILAWLGASERLFQYTEAEAVGRSGGMLFTPEDRRKGIHDMELTTAAAGGRAEDERWHARKDGSVFWASGAVTALTGADGRIAGYAKVLRDRTDTRANVLALQNRLDAMRQESEAKRMALKSLAHELRNPLAPMRNATHLLARTCTDAQSTRLLDMLDRQQRALERLIQDVSNLGDAPDQAHALTLDFAPVDLREVIEASLAACRTEADQRHQRIELLAPQEPVMVVGDRQRLDQAVLNLIGNAVKYTPEDGRILVSCYDEGRFAVVRVEDNGVGIDPALLPRIFDMFVRERNGGPHAPEGSGIGLAVVKRIAGEHGGNVEVRSDGKGKGSEFTLRLPLATGFHGRA